MQERVEVGPTVDNEVGVLKVGRAVEGLLGRVDKSFVKVENEELWCRHGRIVSLEVVRLSQEYISNQNSSAGSTLEDDLGCAQTF